MTEQEFKEKIIQAPDELEFLQRISQMTDESEMKKAEKEYLDHCKAYLDQMGKSEQKSSNQ